MVREHCDSTDSMQPFTTANYAITTTSEIEWWFVFDPLRGVDELGDVLTAGKYPREFPDQPPDSDFHRERRGREAQPPSAFRGALDDVNQQLEDKGYVQMLVQEFYGARLYTGPNRTPALAHTAPPSPLLWPCASD